MYKHVQDDPDYHTATNAMAKQTCDNTERCILGMKSFVEHYCGEKFKGSSILLRFFTTDILEHFFSRVK